MASIRRIEFTTQGDVLYAIVLGWPESRETVIESLGTGQAHCPDAIQQVEWLGAEEPVHWSRDAAGLKVEVPPERPCRHAYTLKIALDR